MRNVVVFDLEYTSWEGAQERKWSGPGEHREVVQIGAVRAHPETLEELGHLSVLVRPSINPQISEYFVSLTGITQERIDGEGVPFAEALSSFLDWSGDARFLSWGNDEQVLLENCSLLGLTPPFRLEDFGDARALFGGTRIDPYKYNSGTILSAFGLPLLGSAHDALNDARSVLAALRELRAI